jgi:hypothetical protein
MMVVSTEPGVKVILQILVMDEAKARMNTKSTMQTTPIDSETEVKAPRGVSVLGAAAA